MHSGRKRLYRLVRQTPQASSYPRLRRPRALTRLATAEAEALLLPLSPCLRLARPLSRRRGSHSTATERASGLQSLLLVGLPTLSRGRWGRLLDAQIIADTYIQWMDISLMLRHHVWTSLKHVWIAALTRACERRACPPGSRWARPRLAGQRMDERQSVWCARSFRTHAGGTRTHAVEGEAAPRVS